MKQPILKRKEQGFTIIEVLIVLAIAGLILVIVFLAVPALQRNSRNTQRTNDAARAASAVNECIANSNGKLNLCDDFSAAESGKYMTVADNQQLVTEGAITIDSFDLQAPAKCNSAGTGVDPSPPARSFAVRYMIETTGTPTERCLGS